MELQDGPQKGDVLAREVTVAEEALWWDRAVAAYPDDATYQLRTDRQIPVFVPKPVSVPEPVSAP